MSRGSSRYVRVYQNGCKVRSVGGASGRYLIRKFWADSDSANASIWNHEKAFQSDSSYTGLCYLVEVQKRSSNRRIKTICVAEYNKGILTSISKMTAKTPVNISKDDPDYERKNRDVIWFDKEEFKEVIVEKGKSTMYLVKVNTGKCIIPIPVTMCGSVVMNMSERPAPTNTKPAKIHTITPSRDNPSYKESEFPVITLCGSTKFKDDFIKAQQELTLQNNIVISVGLFGHADGLYESEITPEKKEMLDKIHLAKIDMSDYIMVINRDGYIGESTRREINYAISKGKPVKYWFTDFFGSC